MRGNTPDRPPRLWQIESVLDLLGLGLFNLPKVCGDTPRRVRRTLPEWIELEPAGCSR